MKKLDILKPAIFILAATCIPLLMFLPVLAPTVDWPGRILPTLSAFAYGASCLVILIRGSHVIWKLPLKKPLRTIVFLLWAILYPFLCLFWFSLCFYLYLLVVRGEHC